MMTVFPTEREAKRKVLLDAVEKVRAKNKELEDVAKEVEALNEVAGIKQRVKVLGIRTE